MLVCSLFSLLCVIRSFVLSLCKFRCLSLLFASASTCPSISTALSLLALSMWFFILSNFHPFGSLLIFHSVLGPNALKFVLECPSLLSHSIAAISPCGDYRFGSYLLFSDDVKAFPVINHVSQIFARSAFSSSVSVSDPVVYFFFSSVVTRFVILLLKLHVFYVSSIVPIFHRTRRQPTYGNMNLNSCAESSANTFEFMRTLDWIMSKV